MNPVALTGLLVAAIRAEEAERPDRLFEDPFAARLAGKEGRDVLERYRGSASNGTVPVIEVRTRWYDESIARCLASGVRQCVILAAGMDTRAYRLAWPEGTRVFEVDQPDVIATKDERLRGVEPKCERRALGINLAEDWPKALREHGFDGSARTLWLVEGLLQYLPRALVEILFSRLQSLSGPGCTVLFDVVGQSLLDSPIMAPSLAMMEQFGAPWIFGTDTPGELLPGWTTVVTEPAIVGNQWKRWPFPAAPPGVPGVPRGYLAEAKS